jgi:uncharacterized membrane protein YciS (DUF1049 family)
MYSSELVMEVFVYLMIISGVYIFCLGLGFQATWFSRFYKWGFSDDERAPISFIATFALIISMSTLISFLMCNHMFSKYQMQNIELHEQVTMLKSQLNDK